MRIILILIMFTTPALAQDSQLDYRLDRLERDMLLLQRQVYREEVPLKNQTGVVSSDAELPQIEVRISNLEEQMRQLYGRVEELEFKTNQLQQMITNNPNAMGSARPQDLAPVPFDSQENDFQQNQRNNFAQNNQENNFSSNMAGESQENLDEKVNEADIMLKNEEQEMQTPEELYKTAFLALSDKDFIKARELLQKFIVRYPNHKLIGNAYYWIGETFYVEKDYVKASSAFKEGYEAMPQGHKAHDNLLKLGLSLENLGKQAEACVVYNKLISEEPAEFILRRAESELRDCE